MPVIGALRKLGRYLGIALAAAVLSAFVYEHVGAWRDGRVLTRVGHSIDIGGRSLNLHCIGEGRPIVIKADRLVSYDLVMAVTNAALERGISSVALATTPQH